MKLLKEICQDISGNRLVELRNGSYALTAVKSLGDRWAVLVVNMSADVMRNPELVLPEGLEACAAGREAEHGSEFVRDVVILTQHGALCKPEVEGNLVRASGIDLMLYEGVIFLIS